MKRILALILILVFCLSGCSMLGDSSDILSMLSPPKEKSDYLGIKEALQENFAGTGTDPADIVYLYPDQGEYRSSIVTCDLNQDGNMEAIVFYRMKNITFGLDIAFLTSNEKQEWQVCNIFSKINTQTVSQVSLVSMESDKSLEAVITFDKYNSHMVEVYSWKNDGVHCCLEEESYTEVGLFDFNYDGFEELLVVDQPEYFSDMTATLYKMEQHYLFAKDKLEWHSDSLSYKESLVGTISQANDLDTAKEVDTIRGMVLEGYVDNYTVQSEILYIEDEKLRLYPNSDYLRHSAQNVPSDLDNDGALEFPVSAPENLSELWYTRWIQIVGSDHQMKMDCVTVHNFRQNYFLVLPENWSRIYKIRSSGDGSQVLFYWLETSGGEVLQNDLEEYSMDVEEHELMQIQILRNKTWQEEKNSLYRQWFVVSKREDTTVVARFFTSEVMSEGTFGAEELREMFHELPY